MLRWWCAIGFVCCWDDYRLLLVLLVLLVLVLVLVLVVTNHPARSLQVYEYFATAAARGAAAEAEWNTMMEE